MMKVANVFITSVITFRLNRRHLPRFVVDQVGKTALPLLVKQLETAYETLCLLPTNVKGWHRDTLAIDAQTYAEFEASMVMCGWILDVVPADETDVSQVH